jgi:hypothetical protein
MTPITPELLRKAGFIYRAPGISGADEWQGMAIWSNVTFPYILRGHSRNLKVGGYRNSRLPDMETLSTLHEILTGEKLKL